MEMINPKEKDNRIGLCPVKFTDADYNKNSIWLYATKPESILREGDYVMIIGKNGKAKFAQLVADVALISTESEEYKWIIKACGAKHPLTMINGEVHKIEWQDNDVIPFI